MATVIKNIPFIGGDTTSFNYDFGLKVAGSVAECPMKLYRGSIDANNPPAPTDPSWTEVTDQKTLDKLKAQNEIPITSTDFTNRTAVWNDKNLVLQTDSQPAVRDDFAGKVGGSTTVCPNIAKLSESANSPSTSLISPNMGTEFGTGSYGNISILDETLKSATCSVNGQMPQQLFSFNLIRMLEDKYGSLPCANDTVSKVAWLKQNISKIVYKWYGYGSCPSGNKVKLAIYTNSDSTYGSQWCGANFGWGGQEWTNTSSSPTLLTGSWAGYGNSIIDENGFINYLVYTDASNGVTPSTIYTDYISLDVQLKPTAGYDLLVPSNPRRDSVTGGNYDNIVMAEKVYNQVVSDFTGKVAGSTTENPNIYGYIAGNYNTLNAPSSFLAENVQTKIDKIKTLDGVCNDTSFNTNGYIAQQLFKFNLIAIFEKQYGTIPATDKVSWLKSNISTLRADWYGYGSCPVGSGNSVNGYYARIYKWDSTNSTWIGDYEWQGGSVNHCFTTGYESKNIDGTGFYNLLAATYASNGVTPSSIYTDYIKLTITFNNGNNALEYFTNNSVEMAVQTTSKASAYLVEVDLTPIATALYGGSNSALKSALKAIQADVWASGYGANGNDVVNGVFCCAFIFSTFNAYGSTIAVDKGINNTNAITKQTFISTNAWARNMMNASNKIYFLIASTNNSTTDIPSVVNLDYLTVRVDLTRTPDVISNPPNINLTDTWNILIRGFAPAWNDLTKTHIIWQLVRDTNNRIGIGWDSNNQKLWVFNFINGAFSYVQIFNFYTLTKYKIANILISCSNNTITAYGLINNSSMEKHTASITAITGNSTLLLGYDTNNTLQADAFIDGVVYIPNKTYDDTTAEAILRGTKEGFEFPELFDINAVTLHPNATRSNGVITLNATAGYQNSTIDIPVLPNNQYTFTFNKTGVNGYIDVAEKYNNVLLGYSGKGLGTEGNVTYTFITKSNTNKISLNIQNTTTGTFTFSNISLKLKM